MPRQEFIELAKEIKKNGKGIKLSKRDLIWKFGHYEKRTSGNVWRINEFLKKEKLIVIPNYQNGWIDEQVELKPKDKAKIKNGNSENSIEEFDPINRLSILEAASNKPISVNRDAKLNKAYHLMWQNDYSQLPIMNNEKDILGVINWQSIAKGLISNRNSDCVKDFISNNYLILDENTPLFEAIKNVNKYGVVFVKDIQGKIKGIVTPSDLNEEFIEQIEPFILLEQIENFIRLFLDNKIIFEELIKLITLNDNDSKREITSLSDLTFGEYLRVIENNEMWEQLKLPFDKADFTNNLHNIRKIRNRVMHFHPDKLLKKDLILLRKTSDFLKDFTSK